MKIWTAYQKNANPETIFPMYQECELNAKAEGYGDVNLLHIASQNAHPEAIAWLLEQGMNRNRQVQQEFHACMAAGAGDEP